MEPAREFSELFMILNRNTDLYFSSHSLIPPFQEAEANLAEVLSKYLKPDRIPEPGPGQVEAMIWKKAEVSCVTRFAKSTSKVESGFCH